MNTITGTPQRQALTPIIELDAEVKVIKKKWSGLVFDFFQILQLDLHTEKKERNWVILKTKDENLYISIKDLASLIFIKKNSLNAYLQNPEQKEKNFSALIYQRLNHCPWRKLESELKEIYPLTECAMLMRMIRQTYTLAMNIDFKLSSNKTAHYPRSILSSPLPIDIGLHNKKYAILKLQTDSPPFVSGTAKKIYHAVDLQTFQLTAWAKIDLDVDLEDSPDALFTVKREFQLSNRLDNHYIIKQHHYTIFRTHRLHRKAGIMMELCKGDLIDLLNCHYGNPPPSSLGHDYWNILENVLCVMVELEEKQIRHNDIKPENICYIQKGTKKIGKLGDFGLAIEYSNDSPSLGQHGTPIYFSPEYCRSILLFHESAFKQEKGVMMLYLRNIYKKRKRERSKSVNDAHGLEMSKAFSVLWQGIECRRNSNQNFDECKNDIWAFGLTLWQLRTGLEPEDFFEGKLRLDSSITECNWVLSTYSQEDVDEMFSSPVAPDSLEELNLQMLSVDPLQRPNAVECLQRFRRLRQLGAEFI